MNLYNYEWYDEAKRLSMASVLMRLGATKKGNRWTPCPICGAAKEKKVKRNPVNVFMLNGEERFWCNVCGIHGNHFELVAQYLFGMSAYSLKLQKRWGDLAEWYGADTFVQVPKLIQAPVVYPPANEVIDFLKACLPAHTNRKIDEYLTGRGIDAQKIPAAAVDKKFDIETLTKKQMDWGMSPWWRKGWLIRYTIILPLFNYKCEIKSILGRTHVKGATKKTSLPLGYSTQNLFLLSPSVQEWILNGYHLEKIYIAEGEIDFLHLCSLGANVIGIRNTAIDHLQLMPWKNYQKCYIGTDNDQKGDRYAAKIPELIRPATALRIHLGEINNAGK